MAATQGDHWLVQPRERSRYEEQFKSLNPINGIVTGAQAKGFMLQSQLPPAVLGQIWSLADTDADGKMDINEFSIACKLINLKLRGFEIPTTLPPALINSIKNTPPAIPPLPTQVINSAPIRTTPVIAPPRPPSAKPMEMGGMIQPPVVQPQLQGLVQQSPLSQPLIGMQQQPLVGIQQPLIAMQQQPLIGMQQQPLVGMQQQPLVGIQPQPLVGMPTQQFVPASINDAPLVPLAPLMDSPLVAPTAQQNLPNFVQQTPIIPPPVKEIPLVADNLAVLGGAPPVVPKPAGSFEPAATATPRSLERVGSIDSPAEWAVPHQTKLKFTQLFNTTDRARTGYLSGPQARNLMLQSKLPHAVLAQIWALADMDVDGRLGCDEFVLAMYLCEQATLGKLPPAVLPMDLIPPAFRRSSVVSNSGVQAGNTSRHGSISSQGSQVADDPASILSQTSFEDKRKENFEKGQAELERRRRALLEAQRAEAEARERKEREEQERRERAKAEQERKRQLEIQQQLQEQLEKERLLEEERKRQQEQRDAARREMERQRQLEWEKQRSQELQQQRHRSQENVLRLKARNQTLSIELNSLTEQVKDLSQKICNTRVGVSNVKTTIDGMRSTRDTHMQELSQLKTKLKEQNARLIALSQEKLKLEAKNKNLNQSDHDELAQTQVAFDNKEILIKQLKDKLLDMEEQIGTKQNDIENNNSQLNDLQKKLSNLVNECELIYNDYEEKKNKVLQLKNINNNAANDYQSAWKDDAAWNTSSGGGGWGDSGTTPATASVTSNSVKYRAIYEFVARNQDEISFQPGDIVMVPAEQNGEPGWLAGEIRGHLGWFPESYVELVTDGSTMDSTLSGIKDELVNRPLEGIAEVPEVTEQYNHTEVEPVAEVGTGPANYYVACYPYQSVEQGDLSFNAGDVINVLKNEGEWWTGKIGDNVGIFPSNYVQKADTAPSEPQVSIPTSHQSMDNGMGKSDLDAEISAINDKRKSVDKSPDFAAMSSNTMTLKNTKKPEIATVLAPYTATSAEQLTLSRGQLIMIRKKSDSGWWEGELQAKGRKRQVGWFPATYVKVLESSGRNSGRNTPVSASKTEMQEMILDKVIAIFPYTAQNADELTFVKDDIISVTAREEPDWWRGELNGVSGLFPSNYVGPLQFSNIEDQKRIEHILELMNSEKQYLDDLLLVINVFEDPLEKSKCISVDLLSKIFINWREILHCDQEFYKDLSACSDYIIGDVISKHVTRMTPYIRFCSKQLYAASLLQFILETSIAFKNEVKLCQSHPLTKGMPLSSFLIKPMQRITKYPLLLSKILNYTSTEHPDYYNLKNALAQMENFCQEVNESVRQSENQIRLKWLQKHVVQNDQINFNSETNSLGPRQFLHYGIVFKVKSGKELLAFLFNDFLLLTIPSRSMVNERLSFYRDSDIELRIYKEPIFIKDLAYTTDIKTSTENLHNIDRKRLLAFKTPKKMLLLYAMTGNECISWVKWFKTAAESKSAYEQTNKKTSICISDTSEQRKSQGRLLVVIMNGMHFQRSSGKIVCENVFCKVQMDQQENCTEKTNAVLKNNARHLNGSPSPLINASFEWNATMQFHIYNLQRDILQIYIYEQSVYTPNFFLGRAEVKLSDVYSETSKTAGPLVKKLSLKDAEVGEIELKLDLHLFA